MPDPFSCLEVSRVRLTLCATILAALPAAAQQVPTRALTAPEAQFEQPFDAVFAIRELASGKVLVTDLGPKAVLLVDLATGEQVNVGRNGQGPGEYQFPGDLLPFRGDSVLLVDRVSRRLLVVSPAGKLGRTIPYPEGLSGMPDARGADRQGRIYFQGSPFRGEPGSGMEVGGALPDSVALIRWDPATKKLDSLTRVKIPAIKMQVSGGQNARTVMMRSQPFAPSDEWTVTPEGRVAVARVGDYHVEWLGAGAPVRGAPVRHEPLKVAAADKQLFLEGMRTSRNRITVNVGGAGPAGGRNNQDNGTPQMTEKDFDWPEVKPPFPTRALQFAPEGQLWVTRSTSARDSTPVYDLFDAGGKLTGRVTLPLGRRLVGMGKGVVYAVRTDEDGLQWLERYRR